MGAVVTLLILMVDPFTQQIVHYYRCSMPLAHLQATIPRVNFLVQNVASTGPMDGEAGPALQAAVIEGALGSVDKVEADCPSTNCTFSQEYSTIGYCSTCTDTSDELWFLQTVVPTNGTGLINVTTILRNGTRFNETLDQSAYDSLFNRMTRTTTVSNSSFSMISGPGKEFNLTGMKVYGKDPQNPNSARHRVAIILAKQFKTFDPKTGNQPSDCDNYGKTDWYCNGLGSATCTLEPCVRTYVSRVKNGVLEEERLDHNDHSRSLWGYNQGPSTDPANRDPPTDSVNRNPRTDLVAPTNDSTSRSSLPYVPYQAIIDLNCISNAERQNLSRIGYTLGAKQRWLQYNATFDPQSSNFSSDASFPISMMVHGCVYMMDSFFHWRLWEPFLEQFLTGEVVGKASNGTMGYIQTLSGPQVLQNIYNYGNTSFGRVDSIFRNISDSITAFMRQNSEAPFYNHPAIGDVMHDETCLAVRWKWLIFPSLVTTMAIAFFISSLARTRSTESRHLPIWKSSSLPLLLQDAEAATTNTRHKDCHDIGVLEKIAKEWDASLVNNESTSSRLVKERRVPRPEEEAPEEV
ncbi:uncharacterized protein KY384_008851 [Bacidia gigantensis]|uniref:uncharacterized protein n=1 Tax=Bacidia gigantensis TaxID=2732470 RepID=UPI001D05091A|nr:uncharacterized protein KY384_008851 [Bacidia gigantensis]KAG8525207.1 hypothetical protein KY384_008851 [Bacidia gigantensis]